MLRTTAAEKAGGNGNRKQRPRPHSLYVSALQNRMTSISDFSKLDLDGKGDGFIEAEVVSKTEAHSTSPGILLCPGVSAPTCSA